MDRKEAALNVQEQQAQQAETVQAQRTAEEWTRRAAPNEPVRAEAEAQAHTKPTGRAAIAKRLTFWRRVRQGVVPEALWLAELKRETAPFFHNRSARRWLKSLNHPNAHVQQEARRAYVALPPAARHLLTVEAYRGALRYTNNMSWVALLIGIQILIAGAAIGELGGFAFAVVLTALFAAATGNQLRSSRQQELAKELFDKTCDPRLVPFLAMRLLPVRNGGAARRQMFAGRNLRNALARLLPLVQEEDAAEWTGAHWYSVLCYLRNPYADVELTQAIVTTAARVGNEEAYRSIKAMTLNLGIHEKAATGCKREAIESGQQILMQAKQECLPILEARLAAQRHAQTLLRPSASSFASAHEILLRPADASLSETPADQLLRPQSQE